MYKQYFSITYTICLNKNIYTDNIQSREEGEEGRIPFAKRIAGARILAARLQVSGLLDEHVERAAAPVFFRLGNSATFRAVLPIAFLLRRIRGDEFQADDHLALVRDRIVERLRLCETIIICIGSFSVKHQCFIVLS